MANKFPKIQKKISAYVMGEDGKIAKQTLIAVGTLIAAAGIVEAPTTHTNALGLTYNASTATATHTHHASHSSHASSDRRLKRNFREIPDVLEKIRMINEVSFEWISDSKKSIN